MAMVSIITPSFNSEKYVDETYQSILRQTYSDWEWIIVDDGSTDRTLDLIRAYAASDQRIRFYLRDRLPKGATTCRNIGIEKSTGKYFVFFDTDDILASFCLEQRCSEMQKHPEMDFIIFQLLIFHEKVDDTMIILNVPDGRDDLERTIMMNPVMGGSSSIWKADSIKKIGMWDVNLLMNQDIELYVRSMASGLKFLLRLDLPPDLFYRTNPHSISREKTKSLQKQLSRAYFFNRIAAHLKNNNLSEKYAPQLRWLFLKFFFDFIFDRQQAVAQKLYDENIDVVQNLPKHYRALCYGLLKAGRNGRYPVMLIRQLNAIVLKLVKREHLNYASIKYTGELRR